MDKEPGRWRGQAWKAAEARAEVDGGRKGAMIAPGLSMRRIIFGLCGFVVIIGFILVFMVRFVVSDADVTEYERQAHEAAERYDRQVAEHQAAAANPRAVAERVCVDPVERAARRLGGELLLNEADRRRRFRFERLWPEYGRKFPDPLRWRANDLPGPYPRDGQRLAVVSGSGKVFNGGFRPESVGSVEDFLGPNSGVALFLYRRGLSMWLEVTYSCTLDVSVSPARVLDVSATKTTGYMQICTHDVQNCTDVRE